MSKIDRTFFFSEVRSRPFGGSLGQQQVDGCNAILDYWESEYQGGDDRWIAYLLGTAYHETAHRMQAIHEYGGADYFNKRYGPDTAVGKALGNTQPGDGNRFHGRGFVQLTGRTNYTDWGKRLGIDLVGNPDLALDVNVATRILVEGSVLGTFTGVKLGNYFNASTNDWYHARQIINGLDTAQEIADLGRQFWAAISYDVGGQEGQAQFRPVLRCGATGEDVRFLQRYLGVTPDGDFGSMTEDVVKAFQTKAGLTADGVVGRDSWRKLLECGTAVRDTPEAAEDRDALGDVPELVGDRPLLRLNSRGRAVEELQTLLGVAVDGNFGPMTLDAVKAFQTRNGLQADGIVGCKTWLVLLS